MEDDDLPSGRQPMGEIPMDVNGVDNCTKRRRVDGATPPAIVDVSGLNGAAPNRHNRFAALADLEIPIENNVSRKGTRNPSSLPNEHTATTGKSFCPPIFLYNVNIKRLVQQLEEITPKILFKIKNVNQHKSKLYLSDAAVHADMMALLKEKKISSYSFTPKENKQMSLVIRGLYYDTEINEIKSALDISVPGVISKVSKFTTKFSLKNDFDTGLFLVTLVPGKKLNDVSHIKFLLSQCIVWEKPKRKDNEIQCRNCQLWGHIAINCNAQFKCVKCNLKHEPKECSRNNEQEKTTSEPCCVNCGESGHPANWRGCPAFKKYLNNKKERLKKAREERTTVSNNVDRALRSAPVTQGRSYASHFHSNENVPKSSIIQEFMKLADFFMGPELTLEQEINKFLGEYRIMSEIDAKAEFLRLFNKVKGSNGP